MWNSRRASAVRAWARATLIRALARFFDPVALRDVRTDFATELAEFNSEADHAHLLVSVPPKAPSPSRSTA